MEENAARFGFAPTRWTIVARAGQPSSPGAEAALSTLCVDYRLPLLNFARWFATNAGGMRADDAEDLTQSFLIHFVQKNLSGAASPQRGRFRTFLCGCFKNFLVDELRRQQQKCKIPLRLTTSLNANEDQENSPVDPVAQIAFDCFDRDWAEIIRERVIVALAVDYRSRSKGALFAGLRSQLIGQQQEKPYSELAAELGISRDSLKKEAERLHKRFRQQFRAEVNQTVNDHDEAEEEYRYLRSLLISGETT